MMPWNRPSCPDHPELQHMFLFPVRNQQVVPFIRSLCSRGHPCISAPQGVLKQLTVQAFEWHTSRLPQPEGISSELRWPFTQACRNRIRRGVVFHFVLFLRFSFFRGHPVGSKNDYRWYEHERGFIISIASFHSFCKMEEFPSNLIN